MATAKKDVDETASDLDAVEEEDTLGLYENWLFLKVKSSLAWLVHVTLWAGVSFILATVLSNSHFAC